MGMVEEHAGWGVLVDHAVDDLVAELEQQAGREHDDEASSTDLAVRPQTFRDQLVAYPINLLATADVRAESIQCNNRESTVGCVFVLRPDGRPYYRCNGHAPPDCYDEDYNKIPCP